MNAQARLLRESANLLTTLRRIVEAMSPLPMEASGARQEPSPYKLSPSSRVESSMKPTGSALAQAVQAAFRGDFKEPSKVLTTPRAKQGAGKTMEILRCSDCGARIGVVTDRRFGLMPSGSLCIACSVPAFRKTRTVVF